MQGFSDRAYAYQEALPLLLAVLLGRNCGPRAQVPDVLAKGMAAVAAVGDYPAGHARQQLKPVLRLDGV